MRGGIWGVESKVVAGERGGEESGEPQTTPLCTTIAPPRVPPHLSGRPREAPRAAAPPDGVLVELVVRGELVDGLQVAPPEDVGRGLPLRRHHDEAVPRPLAWRPLGVPPLHPLERPRVLLEARSRHGRRLGLGHGCWAG